MKKYNFGKIFLLFSVITICSCININFKSKKHYHQNEYNRHKFFSKNVKYKSQAVINNGVDTFMDLVIRSGYFAEEYEVTTEDGYILVLHRISGSPRNPAGFGKPVVLLLHGLMGASDIWVVRGPDQDLAYLLVDNGFDVWALNVRGNFYSNRHKILSTSDPAFWEFSWHEIGIYDVPASIDYILQLTGQNKLSLIGHSMGGTEEFVLLSMRPEYNEKINVALAWAPVATVTHAFPGLVVNFLFRFGSQLEKVLDLFNLHQLFPRVSERQRSQIGFWFRLCWYDNFQPYCKKLMASILGVPDLDVDTRTILCFWGHYPQGTSIRTINHYGQIVLNRKFAQYDFGQTENLIKYKNFNPPEYQLHKISTPIIIYHGTNDHITNKQDVDMMLKRMPSAVAKEVPYKYFGHIDFISSNKTKKVLYNDVIETLLNYNKNNNKVNYYL